MKKVLSLFLAFVLMFGLSSSIVVQAKENGKVIYKQGDWTITELGNGVTEIKLEKNGKVTTGYVYDDYVLVNGEKHYFNKKQEEVYSKNTADMLAYGIDDWQLIRTYNQTSDQYCTSLDVFEIVLSGVLLNEFKLWQGVFASVAEYFSIKYYRVGKVYYNFDLTRQVYGKTGQLNYCKRVDRFYGENYSLYITTETYEGYGLF